MGILTKAEHSWGAVTAMLSFTTECTGRPDAALPSYCEQHAYRPIESGGMTALHREIPFGFHAIVRGQRASTKSSRGAPPASTQLEALPP